MENKTYSVITGTGSYIPSRIVTNEDFISNEFYESNGIKIEKSGQEIADKFQEITTIAERRYISDNMTTTDMAYLAAIEAIKAAGIEQEELDYVIVANNFGDTTPNNRASDNIPAMASKVKHKLGIKNPETVAYDITFGCPGWLQAVIQADYFIKSGDAKKILVIGADVLSRISDPHDRDCMLYADGAGAVVLECRESSTPIGIIAHNTRSDTFSHAGLLYMGSSNNPNFESPKDLFLKMNGRRLYQYALETVPQAIKACIDKSGFTINDLKKVLIHQANGKMDDAILKRLFSLYGIENTPDHIMPMTVHNLGNTSVATLPTLYDLIIKNNMKNHQIHKGDLLIFASVGAGMNINAVVYKMD
jgi:3-oxoacyl-[acyl-carrier-protein] synthase III